MPRPQFTIRTLLWLTLVVAAFLGGIAYGKRLERQAYAGWFASEVEKITPTHGSVASPPYLKDWPVPK